MKKILSIFLTVILIFSVVGCGNDSTKKNGSKAGQEKKVAENLAAEASGKKPADKITIYISGPEAMINKLEAGFEKTHGDVCDFVIMSCGQVRNKVWTEKEAGKIQADVVCGSDPIIFNKLDNEGLLEPIELKEKGSMKEEFITDKDYLLFNERYVTLLYNKDVLKDNIPKSFKELTDPEYRSKIVMADANQSATAFAIAASLYQLNDNSFDIFNKLKANSMMLSKSNGQVPSKIMEGQFALGIGPHDSVVRLAAKAKKQGFETPLKVAWPEEGVIAIQRPVAVIKNPDRSESKDQIVKELINFIVSKETQTMTTKFGFVSVRNDIENTFLPEEITPYKIDWEDIVKNEDQIKTEYQSIFHS